MRRVALAFAFVALAAATAAADADRVSRTFTVAPGSDLRLNTFSGHVRISAVDSQQITIDAVRHGTRAQLDAIKLDIGQDGSVITIEANRRERGWFSWWGHSDVVDTDFDVKVPHRTNVTVHSFSSDVQLNGIDGDLDVHTFSAPVRLDAIGGSATVHTFSGPVTVKAAAWSEPDSMNVDTFSGSVDVRLPAGAHAIADFKSFSGRLSSPLPLLIRSTNRRATTAELDGSGPAGHIRVKTFSGNLTIDR